MYYFMIEAQKPQKVAYNVADAPIQHGQLQLSGFFNNMVNLHYHKELEYVAVLKGSMKFHVNAKTYNLTEGTGLIVNADQLHFILPDGGADCCFQSLLIPPIYMDEHRKFVDPLMFDAIFLTDRVPWQGQVMADIRKMYDLCEDCPACYPLRLKNVFYDLWICVCENLSEPPRLNRRLFSRTDAFKQMLAYIHENYQKPLQLDEIARAGHVSKSVCCRIFKEYLRQTPFTYLMHYRVQVSLRYLAETKMNITEIAAETGFSGSSYYAETFKRFYQCSPMAYRKQL